MSTQHSGYKHMGLGQIAHADWLKIGHGPIIVDAAHMLVARC